MSSSTAAVADKAQLLSGDEPASTSPASVELTVSSEVSPATTATATSAPVRNRAGQSASVTKKTPKQIEVEEKMAARLDELEARPGRSGSLTAAAEVAVAPGSVNKGARILSKLLTKVNSKTGEDSPDEEGVINLQREITSALYTKTLEQQNFKTVFTLSKAKHKPKHVEITNYFAEPNFSKPAANRIQLHRSSGGDFTETALRIAGADVEEAQWQHDQAQTQAAGKNADGIAADVDAGSKFGTWDGVFVSCLLNIFGVIMFLRLGWVVGQAGIVQGIAIILLGGVVTILTTASMAAIAASRSLTNAAYVASRLIARRFARATTSTEQTRNSTEKRTCSHQPSSLQTAFADAGQTPMTSGKRRRPSGRDRVRSSTSALGSFGPAAASRQSRTCSGFADRGTSPEPPRRFDGALAFFVRGRFGSAAEQVGIARLLATGLAFELYYQCPCVAFTQLPQRLLDFAEIRKLV